MAAQVESHVWELIPLLAVNRVLPGEALFGANLLVEKLGKSGGKSDERGSGIEDDAGVLEICCLVTEGDGIESDLPVSFAAKWELGNLAGVVILIDATENDLGLVAISILGVPKVEGKDLFVKKTLIDHVIERWHDLVYADGIIAQAHNSIKTTESESEARLRCGFSKVLVLELEVTDLNSVL